MKRIAHFIRKSTYCAMRVFSYGRKTLYLRGWRCSHRRKDNIEKDLNKVLCGIVDLIQMDMNYEKNLSFRM
jgi:hypothetical protein